MNERYIAENIFGCSRNHSVLCNGRVENTCFMANRNAGAAYRLENGISNENMDIRCILASYKRRKVE